MNRSITLSMMCVLFTLTADAQLGFDSYTTLMGYWNVQSTFRTPQYIRQCPNTEIIHVILMAS
ncbi:MAG: hypothetical protein AAB393_16475, partial [Bacteroidota bacterium]